MTFDVEEHRGKNNERNHDINLRADCGGFVGYVPREAEGIARSVDDGDATYVCPIRVRRDLACSRR